MLERHEAIRPFHFGNDGIQLELVEVLEIVSVVRSLLGSGLGLASFGESTRVQLGLFDTVLTVFVVSFFLLLDSVQLDLAVLG